VWRHRLGPRKDLGPIALTWLALAAALDVKAEVGAGPRRPGDLERSVLLPSSELGPWTDFATGIAKTAAYAVFILFFANSLILGMFILSLFQYYLELRNVFTRHHVLFNGGHLDAAEPRHHIGVALDLLQDLIGIQALAF
jgi:hypothetical protein